MYFNFCSMDIIHVCYECVRIFFNKLLRTVCKVICSIISRATVWYPHCIKILQSWWICCTLSSALKMSGLICKSRCCLFPCSKTNSSGLNWNLLINAPTTLCCISFLSLEHLHNHITIKWTRSYLSSWKELVCSKRFFVWDFTFCKRDVICWRDIFMSRMLL